MTLPSFVMSPSALTRNLPSDEDTLEEVPVLLVVATEELVRTLDEVLVAGTDELVEVLTLDDVEVVTELDVVGQPFTTP